MIMIETVVLCCVKCTYIMSQTRGPFAFWKHAPPEQYSRIVLLYLICVLAAGIGVTLIYHSAARSMKLTVGLLFQTPQRYSCSISSLWTQKQFSIVPCITTHYLQLLSISWKVRNMEMDFCLASLRMRTNTDRNEPISVSESCLWNWNKTSTLFTTITNQFKIPLTVCP